MLIAAKKSSLINKYQNDLERTLKTHLKKSGSYALGHQGDNFEHDVKFNDKMWWSSFDIEDSETSPRFWNGFGLVPFRDSGTQDIVVEINIPHEGINRRVSGMFAKEPGINDVFIVHRGRIGGGRKGIGKDSFKTWYRGSWVNIYEDKKNTCEAILITSIYSKRASADIFNFVKQVKQFKDEVTQHKPSRQIKTDISQNNPIAFDPEYSGTKKGKKKTSIFRQECNHGIIVNALEKWVRRKKIKRGKRGKISTFNTQLIDLGVQLNRNIKEIYEVKTNFDRQSIYTGIGQLLFHSVGNPATSRILVLPITDSNNNFRDILKKLNIKILFYKLNSTLDVSFYDNKRNVF